MMPIWIIKLFLPIFLFEAAGQFRIKSIPVKISIDRCEIYPIRQLKSLGVKIRPADDECLFGFYTLNRFLDRTEKSRVFRWFRFCPAHDKILAVGQGFADAFEGFPAHDHGTAGGQLFEMLEILGEMPGEFIVLPDHPISRHRHNMIKFHRYLF